MPAEQMEISLTEDGLSQIEFNYEQRGLFGNWEFKRMALTIRIQREAIKALLSYFRRDPLRLVASADPVRVDTLDELAKRCGLPHDRRYRREQEGE